MKKGKIILGVAAFVVTALSTITFKAAGKLTSSGHYLYVQVTDGLGENINCALCRSVRTKLAGGRQISSCVTISSARNTILARFARTFFLEQKDILGITCVSPFTKATKSL